MLDLNRQTSVSATRHLDSRTAFVFMSAPAEFSSCVSLDSFKNNIFFFIKQFHILILTLEKQFHGCTLQQTSEVYLVHGEVLSVSMHDEDLATASHHFLCFAVFVIRKFLSSQLKLTLGCLVSNKEWIVPSA